MATRVFQRPITDDDRLLFEFLERSTDEDADYDWPDCALERLNGLPLVRG